MTFTLPSRTSSLSTPTTKPPSQAAKTATLIRVSAAQLAVAARLPSVKFMPTTPAEIEQAAANQERESLPPAGAILDRRTSSIGTGPFGSRRSSSASRSSRSSSSGSPPAPSDRPAAPSEVQATIDDAIAQAEDAAAGMDDPIIPETSSTPSVFLPPPREESSGLGSKLLIGAGIVLGGILVFRFLK